MRNRHQQERREWVRYAGVFFGILMCSIAIFFHQHIGAVLGGIVARTHFSETSVLEALPKTVLASRLAHAEAELARMKYQALLYTLEVEKNQSLRAALGLREEEVVARGTVVARPPRTLYDTLLVSFGSNTTVSPGDVAYVSGILVGEVVEVHAETALVLLYSAPGEVLDVTVGIPSAIVAMRGEGSGSFWFEVPKEVSLVPGDQVTSLHTGEALVAVVQRVLDEPDKTTLFVHAASPVSMADMTVVEFIRPLPGLE